MTVQRDERNECPAGRGALAPCHEGRGMPMTGARPGWAMRLGGGLEVRARATREALGLRARRDDEGAADAWDAWRADAAGVPLHGQACGHRRGVIRNARRGEEGRADEKSGSRRTMTREGLEGCPAPAAASPARWRDARVRAWAGQVGHGAGRRRGMARWPCSAPMRTRSKGGFRRRSCPGRRGRSPRSGGSPRTCSSMRRTGGGRGAGPRRPSTPQPPSCESTCQAPGRRCPRRAGGVNDCLVRPMASRGSGGVAG